MKKLLSLFLTVFTLVTMLTGCGASKTSEAEIKDSNTKTYKVAMISDTSISDGGWGAACYNAMVTAAVRNSIYRWS